MANDDKGPILMRLFFAFPGRFSDDQLQVYADVCKAIGAVDLRRGVDRLINAGGDFRPSAGALRAACVAGIPIPDAPRHIGRRRPSRVTKTIFAALADERTVFPRCRCGVWFQTTAGYLACLKMCEEAGDDAPVLCHPCIDNHFKSLAAERQAGDVWAWPVLVAITRDNQVPTAGEVTDLDRLGHRGERVSRMRRAGMFSGRRAER